MQSENFIINSMINKNVIVENEEVEIRGKLLSFKPSIKAREHRPELLVLQKGDARHIIRQWVATKTKERVTRAH